MVRRSPADMRRPVNVIAGKARQAGLDDECIEALFMTTFRTFTQEDIA
jgi:GntR family transcriptional regulator